jgi:F-type H+-transporting ATPase subunit a
VKRWLGNGIGARPSPGKGLAPMLILLTMALLFPAAAFARGKFDPTTEFEQHEWVSIHLGGLNLSITKAVVYLMIGTVLTIALGIGLMRLKLSSGKDLGRRQTIGEQIYEIAQVQVAEQGLPTKAIGRWFPYVATIMLFIWVVNMLGFIPLPLTGEKWHGVPTWGIYAATSSISVTLALAILTFIFTHVEGIRWNGPVKYFKSWIPEAPKGLLLLIVPLEVLGQFMRLISLSVRLFANMLAGHILILTFIGLMFILQSVILAVFVIPIAAVFYLFEVVIVVSIQAFIFAALSAIYIGSAIEPEH